MNKTEYIQRLWDFLGDKLAEGRGGEAYDWLVRFNTNLIEEAALIAEEDTTKAIYAQLDDPEYTEFKLGEH